MDGKYYFYWIFLHQDQSEWWPRLSLWEFGHCWNVNLMATQKSSSPVGVRPATSLSPSNFAFSSFLCCKRWLALSSSAYFSVAGQLRTASFMPDKVSLNNSHAHWVPVQRSGLRVNTKTLTFAHEPTIKWLSWGWDNRIRSHVTYFFIDVGSWLRVPALDTESACLFSPLSFSTHLGMEIIIQEVGRYVLPIFGRAMDILFELQLFGQKSGSKAILGRFGGRREAVSHF